jgi:hypothetical protein
MIHCDKEVRMIVADLEGAECCKPGMDPDLWDLDAHHHPRLGRGNSCWLCGDVKEICFRCPVIQECYRRAVDSKASHMIYAGHSWSSGRPKKLNR